MITAIGLVLVLVFSSCAGMAYMAGWVVLQLARGLIRRGEMSGADDLDDVLRAEIDGDGEAYAADLMACGCSYAGASVSCTCGWRTCLVHSSATHLCEPDPIDRWQYAPDRDPMRVNRMFDALAAGAELADLHNAPHDLSRYYLIGDEK